jgi:murein L,D-transpeptidase YafK
LVALVIGPVDRVSVDKSARTLSLMRGGKAVYTTPISLGKNPVGQKQREGDGRTPEGVYRLSWRDPSSDYHRAILISYPTKMQASRAEAAGVAPGGEIMVHGQKYPWRWFSRSPLTNGCVGLSNTAMDVVWYATSAGMPITIRP